MCYKMCHLKYLVAGYVSIFSIWCGLTARTEVPGTRHPADLFLRGAAQGVPLAIVLPFSYGAVSAIELQNKWFPKKEPPVKEEPVRPPVEQRKGGLLNIVTYGKD